jgi:hypothetical protein
MASVLTTNVLDRAGDGRTTPAFSAAAIDTIIEHAAAGTSARAIARMLDVPHPRILRLLARPENVERLRELRHRERKRLDKQRQRERDAALAAAGTPRPQVERRGRGSVDHDADGNPIRYHGHRDARGDVFADLYLDAHGEWRRRAVVGSDSYARAKDWTLRGIEPPPSWSAERPFGSPGFPRPPVGHQEPRTRVRLPVGHPLNRASVELSTSILTVDLEAAIRDGAIPL